MCGFDLFAARNVVNSKLAHQAFHSGAGKTSLSALRGVPKFACATDRLVLGSRVLQLFTQVRIALGAVRRPCWDHS